MSKIIKRENLKRGIRSKYSTQQGSYKTILNCKICNSMYLTSQFICLSCGFDNNIKIKKDL